MSPGSTPWLMAHEIRLSWRAGGGRTRWIRLVLFSFVVLAMAGLGVPMGLALRDHHPNLGPAAVVGVGLAFGFVLVMAFSTSLAFTAAGFIDRGDIDLLLCSPLPVRRLLTARLAAVALRSISLWLFLFGPLFVAIACLAGARWLGGLTLLFDAGLTGTAVASWLIVGLIRVMGPKKVKSTTTIVTALSALSVGILPTLLNTQFGGPQRLARSFGHLPILSPDGFAAFPARALFGDPWAILALAAAALALFAATTWLLAPSFAIIATRSDSPSRRSAGTAPLRGFGGGLFPLLLAKNYRLLLRNHALLLQILARTVAFVPVLALNVSQSGGAMTSAKVVGALVLVLGQAGGATVWAFIAAETQPDLLASSPHPPALFRRVRLAAALLPALTLVLIAAAVFWRRSSLAGLSVLAMGAGACLSSAVINTTARAASRASRWSNTPRPSVGAQFADMIAGLCWSSAAYLLASGSIWTPLPVWLALSTIVLWREVTRRTP